MNNKTTKSRKSRDPSSNGRHMSAEQRAHLIAFMESHPTFAKTNMCPGPMGKFQGDVLWTSLAEELNKMGPAVRPVKKWRQVSRVNTPNSDYVTAKGKIRVTEKPATRPRKPGSRERTSHLFPFLSLTPVRHVSVFICYLRKTCVCYVVFFLYFIAAF